MACYLSSLGIPFKQWSRRETLSSTENLKTEIKEASHILLLITDSAINRFFDEHLRASDHKTVVHFSGCLESAQIHGAHPLMSFSKELYSLETYQSIPFVTTSKIPFGQLLPGLPNTSFTISPEQKALYHALCVLSGNFTTLLWQQMSQGLEGLNLPADVHIPYMRQIFKNLELSPETALTGPLARKDLPTVIANVHALSSNPGQKIYRAFLEVYYPESIRHLEGVDL
jgi:hypothetical protein